MRVLSEMKQLLFCTCSRGFLCQAKLLTSPSCEFVACKRKFLLLGPMRTSCSIQYHRCNSKKNRYRQSRQRLLVSLQDPQSQHHPGIYRHTDSQRSKQSLQHVSSRDEHRVESEVASPYRKPADPCSHQPKLLVHLGNRSSFLLLASYDFFLLERHHFDKSSQRPAEHGIDVVKGKRDRQDEERGRSDRNGKVSGDQRRGQHEAGHRHGSQSFPYRVNYDSNVSYGKRSQNICNVSGKIEDVEGNYFYLHQEKEQQKRNRHSHCDDAEDDAEAELDDGDEKKREQY